jgi:hypothetical protein
VHRGHRAGGVRRIDAVATGEQELGPACKHLICRTILAVIEDGL